MTLGNQPKRSQFSLGRVECHMLTHESTRRREFSLHFVIFMQPYRLI